MRAGKLDRVIEIRRPSLVDDGYGNLVPGAPETVGTMRAQIVQSSTEEFFRAWGTADETAIIFRMRFIDLYLSDEIREGGEDGTEYDIREIKEIGRRRGLEVRCVSKP